MFNTVNSFFYKTQKDLKLNLSGSWNNILVLIGMTSELVHFLLLTILNLLSFFILQYIRFVRFLAWYMFEFIIEYITFKKYPFLAEEILRDQNFSGGEVLAFCKYRSKKRFIRYKSVLVSDIKIWLRRAWENTIDYLCPAREDALLYNVLITNPKLHATNPTLDRLLQYHRYHGFHIPRKLFAPNEFLFSRDSKAYSMFIFTDLNSCISMGVYLAISFIILTGLSVEELPATISALAAHLNDCNSGIIFFCKHNVSLMVLTVAGPLGAILIISLASGLYTYLYFRFAHVLNKCFLKVKKLNYIKFR